MKSEVFIQQPQLKPSDKSGSDLADAIRQIKDRGLPGHTITIPPHKRGPWGQNDGQSHPAPAVMVYGMPPTLSTTTVTTGTKLSEN
jgi:hypothetical protein